MHFVHLVVFLDILRQVQQNGQPMIQTIFLCVCKNFIYIKITEQGSNQLSLHVDMCKHKALCDGHSSWVVPGHTVSNGIC